MRRAWGRGGRRGRGALVACCGVVALATILAACGPASSDSAGSVSAASTGNTVVYAMQPGGQAAYPFPFISDNEIGQDSVYNTDYFQYLMYRPLYWFGQGTGAGLNLDLSLAEKPVFSGQTVTINLNHGYKWSDGEAVDAQDVVFWLNMMKGIPASSLNANVYDTAYGLPNDVNDIRATGKYTVKMTIIGQYSETWFTDNELSTITPMPLYWDRTAAGPSDCVSNMADCNAVYEYLNGQALKPSSTFAASPIWSVVDGPWKIQSLTSQGNLTLTYNTKYSGPVHPGHITKFIEVPYTTEQAEYNVLQDSTGSQIIDVGYLPTVDAPVPAEGASVGANPPSLPNYSISAVTPLELTYFPYNFANTSGQAPIFKQLYFRQAFQSLVDQEGIINGPLHGYGEPSISPVGDYADLAPALNMAGDQWTLNVQRAITLLRSHGWQVNPNGTDTCVSAGTGPSDCGARIPAGTKLDLSLMYATGTDWIESAVKELASNASLAGIQITLNALPFSNVTGDAFGCAGKPSLCSWQLAFWGSWTFEPDYLPTGDTLFESGAVNNAGQYDNATNDRLILDTLHARTASAFKTAMNNWQVYLADELPVVFEPNSPTLIETIKGLNIGPQNSALTIMPEEWYYQK